MMAVTDVFRRRLRPSLSSAFLTAFVVALACGTAGGALAISRVQSGSACHPTSNDFSGPPLTANGGIATWGAAWNRWKDTLPNWYPAVFLCPGPNDDELPAWTITRIFGRIRDARNDAETDLWACVTFWNQDGGGACGAVAGSGANWIGDTDLQVDPSAWQAHPWDYTYLYVELPLSGATTGQSTLRGWWFEQ